MPTLRAYPLLFSFTLLLTPLFTQADAIIDAAASPERPISQRLRDEYRHPQQTLRFFDVKPDMKVVEIWPDSGWYTNILAPLLHDNGKLYAAQYDLSEKHSPYFKKTRAAFEKKVAADPNYQQITVTTFSVSHPQAIAPAHSVDRVLTFRNVHNWYMQAGDEGVQQAFTTFYKALKKGGVLGVVDHRLPEDDNSERQQTSGYLKQSYVIAMAEQAGFELAAKSEVNANPADTTEYAKGVWTLPPVLTRGEQDRQQYLQIGESDRMTLKFVKP